MAIQKLQEFNKEQEYKKRPGEPGLAIPFDEFIAQEMRPEWRPFNQMLVGEQQQVFDLLRVSLSDIIQRYYSSDRHYRKRSLDLSEKKSPAISRRAELPQ